MCAGTAGIAAMQLCTLLACFPATLAHSQPCKRRRGLFAPVTAACATLAAVRSSIKVPRQPPTHRAQGPPQSRWTEPPDGHAAMVNQLEHKDQPAACVNALHGTTSLRAVVVALQFCSCCVLSRRGVDESHVAAMPVRVPAAAIVYGSVDRARRREDDAEMRQ